MKLFLLILSLLLFTGCYLEPEKEIPLPQAISDTDWIKIEMSDENYRDFSKSSFYNEYFSAYIKTESTIFSAKIKYHGNSTREDIRKSYTLKIYSPDSPDTIIGNYIMSGSSGDDSLCKSHLTGLLLSNAGLIASKEWLKDLYINNEYFGPYNIYENINDEQFFLRRDLKISSLYKASFTPDIFNTTTLLEKAFYKKLPDNSMNYDDLLSLYRVLNIGLSSAPFTEFENIFDITNCLNYIAVTFITANWDGVNKNFYLYFNPDINKFQFIPWDTDYTFQTDKISSSIPIYQNSLFEKLYAEPYYKSIIDAKMKELFVPNLLTDRLSLLNNYLIDRYPLSPYTIITDLNLDNEIDKIYEYIDLMSVYISNL